MFSEIYDVIDEGEEIYFDITHGLRNIPMLVMAILEYAKVTKGYFDWRNLLWCI